MPIYDDIRKVMLVDPDLGILDLGDAPYVVESFQIGSPSVRENAKNRALADGVFDDAMYHGSSAITINTRLATKSKCNANEGMGALRDQLAAYMHPRRRPRLGWRYPWEDDFRWATVRGQSWPFMVNGPKYPTLAVQFVNIDGQQFHGDPTGIPNLIELLPGGEIDGRTYDLTFNRAYPHVTGPVGAMAAINTGSTWADWVLTVFGPFDTATVQFNGTTVEFNGAVINGFSVVVDSRRRTATLTDGSSYYSYLNYLDWDWQDILLPPRATTMVQFEGELSGSPSGQATLEWWSTSI